MKLNVSEEPLEPTTSTASQRQWVIGMVVGSAIVLFICASVRHALFRSTAFDLGWFDQATYLISQGQPPIVSFAGFHILGDHAAWIFYPLALLYKIYPSVHWLFAVQAIALALGALPTWYLARQAGLKDSLATVFAAVYLLHPLIFNVNLFDFHPEVMALPAFLGAVLAARSGKIGWFCLLLLLLTGCKAVLSVTIVALGVWLLLFEARRLDAPLRQRCQLAGGLAIAIGVAWFLIATRVIIPHFSGTEVAAVGRYQYLGSSVGEIALNLLLKPHLVLGNLLTLANLEYLCLLFIPVLWGLSPRHLDPLVAAVPMLSLNLLSTILAQKNLVHHYSVPIFPFLLLAMIATLAHGEGWVRSRRGILLCAIVGFLALAKFSYFGTRYISWIDTWQATREAIAQVQTQGSVVTTAEIAPHLTHRPVVVLAMSGFDPKTLPQFDYVLLNIRYPGWRSSPEFARELLQQLQQNPRFQMRYHRDDVYLFVRQPEVKAHSSFQPHEVRSGEVRSLHRL